MVGFQVAELSPDPLFFLNAVRVVSRACGSAGVGGRGTTVPVPAPVLAVAAPDQYSTSVLGIVSAADPPPVVMLVADTLAIQVAVNAARWSETVTEPSCPLTWAPGA